MAAGGIAGLTPWTFQEALVQNAGHLRWRRGVIRVAGSQVLRAVVAGL